MRKTPNANDMIKIVTANGNNTITTDAANTQTELIFTYKCIKCVINMLFTEAALTPVY